MSDSSDRRSERVVFAVVGALAAASFLVSKLPVLLDAPTAAPPRVVLGGLTALFMTVVAIGLAVGTRRPVREGWQPTHLAVAAVWAVYLAAALWFVITGERGWIVLLHLAVAIGGGLVFAYTYDPE